MLIIFITFLFSFFEREANSIQTKGLVTNNGKGGVLHNGGGGHLKFYLYEKREAEEGAHKVFG